MKKRLWPLLVALFYMGTLFWMTFHGRWGSAYVVETDTLEGEVALHRFLMDLDSRPLWDPPHAPARSAFEAHFSRGSLPDGGVITVFHEWDLWLHGVLAAWWVGSLLIVPVSFLVYRRNRALGSLARLGAGLVVAALACLLLWLAIGGWGPPAPLFFGVMGLLGGSLWASVYARNAPAASAAEEADSHA